MRSVAAMRPVATLVILLVAAPARAEVELVPSVRRGHPVAWKVGAALTVMGLPSCIDARCLGSGGPITWFAGAGGRPDEQP